MKGQKCTSELYRFLWDSIKVAAVDICKADCFLRRPRPIFLHHGDYKRLGGTEWLCVAIQYRVGNTLRVTTTIPKEVFPAATRRRKFRLSCHRKNDEAKSTGRHFQYLSIFHLFKLVPIVIISTFSRPSSRISTSFHLLWYMFETSVAHILTSYYNTSVVVRVCFCVTYDHNLSLYIPKKEKAIENQRYQSMNTYT